MRFGSDIWAGNEMLAVAEHAGKLDAGKVRRVEFSNDQEIQRALRNGIIESGALMLDEALVLSSDGVDLVIVAAVDSSVGSDAVLAQPELGTLADLTGRRIGVQLNSGGLQILRRALAAAHMTVNDVVVVNTPPDRHVEAFTSRSVDAVVTYDPMRTLIAARGGRDLFNSSAIAGDVINVLVVRRDYMATHAAQVRALVAAWWAGRDTFTHDESQRAWAAARLGLTPGQLQQAFSLIELFDAARSRELVAGPSPQLRATADRFQGAMRENGRLSRAVDTHALFTPPQGWQP